MFSQLDCLKTIKFFRGFEVFGVFFLKRFSKTFFKGKNFLIEVFLRPFLGLFFLWRGKRFFSSRLVM